jgi:shikimate O-hydroxycinnamoyltransferase
LIYRSSYVEAKHMMKITVESWKVVTPSSSSSCCSGGRPSPDADGAVPLTAFDKVTYDLYMHGLYFFPPPAPPSSVLVAGLAAALAEYPEWAGRLGVDAHGNRAILLNGKGARFVEATADVPLRSVLPLEPATSETLSLHPAAGAESDDAAVGGEVLLLQVTRFPCGSFVVGTAAQHLVSDGAALRSFLNAWAQASRGAAIDDPVPLHDRVCFFLPRDPLRVEFEHRGAEYKPHPRTEKSRNKVDDRVVIHRVNFSRKFVAELKARASAGAPRPRSTLQCVAAHLWRCVTKARRLGDLRTATELRIAVNGRRRMKNPRVPEEYTGNVVLWARPTTTSAELLRSPLRQVVELVSKAVAAMDDVYFRSFVDFASSGVVEEEGLLPTADPLETVLSPNVEVDSMLGLPFQDFDFGGGPPFFFMPSYSPVEGLICIVSSFSGDGSIDAYVPLFSQAMDVFKNCCRSLAATDARL